MRFGSPGRPSARWSSSRTSCWRLSRASRRFWSAIAAFASAIATNCRWAPRGGLERQRGRGLLQRFGRAARPLLVATLQEVHDGLHGLRIALAGLAARAGGVAAGGRVRDAGGLERAGDRDRAGAERGELARE